jgi:hypothetical protein
VNEKDLWTGIFTAAIPAGNRRSRFGSKGEEQSDPVSRVCMQGPCGVHVVLVCVRNTFLRLVNRTSQIPYLTQGVYTNLR